MDYTIQDFEQMTEAAARYCLSLGWEKEGKLLTQSTIIDIEQVFLDFDEPGEKITISGPAELCQILNRNRNRVDAERDRINEAVGAATGFTYGFYIEGKMEQNEYDTNWRARLVAEFETTGQVHNNNPWKKEPFIYDGMRFSSPPEVEIAKALDKAGIMYLPNALTRVGSPNNMKTRFPDFLICYDGKWGILEVDGKAYHKETATQDHERARLLQRHGRFFFTRYDAMECQKDPDKVVRDFLDLLAKF